MAREGRPRSSDFVSRIKNENFDGYRVRVDRADFPYTSEHFSVAKYGNEEAAEKAAREYRAGLEFDVPANGAHLHDPRNPYGLVGVTLAVYRRPDRSIESVSWRSTWWDGRTRSKTFAVLKYGWAEAFCLAVRARERNTADLDAAARKRVPQPSHEVWTWASQRDCPSLPLPA